ncbi:ARM repeat-containing protein [Dendrothele bispora CBS 962.96]|uniref:non-specific serine/threonine protein kinase n=1 Tax=Dendrothele bispora (strain CBS 962.96) TaxID=1314807 RepID=A0A4V4HG66_DENBC|nr:ARM repeat-containing protein [Dendrothele bispora CBS 962.96]
MGNVQSGLALTRTTGALDSFISELGNDIVYEKSLGSSRFLKTVKCRHQNGYLVVKVFIKADPGVALRSYLRRLKVDREALQDIANVYNYQSFVETEKAGYITRQWIASNLYDRISTRPFLSTIEKKWIVFQLLTGLRDARNRKVSHGDIKSENILVTSWNWVYLSDFASYKPAYLPLDDPSDFSFFFDTSGRRTCYIAPERFFTAASNPEISAKKLRLAMEDNEGRRDGKVTEAMDCFSVGCVIAELFLEGAPLFTLSQLFKYREGEYNVDTHLAVIEDEGVRNMIKRMIDLDPASRPTFDSLLHTSRGTVFPESFFSFLHNYVSTINELPTNSPFSSNIPPPTPSTPVPGAVPSSVSGTSLRPSPSAGLNSAAGASPTPSDRDLLPSDSDHRMERLWSDFDSVEPYIISDTVEDTVTMDVKIDYNSSTRMSKPFQDILPVELCIPNRESKLASVLQNGLRATTDGPALIILALVTANIRNCSLPSSKVRALDVFLALSPHLTDEAKLDRMVPYIMDLLYDDAPIVRVAAIRSLVQVLMLVTVITPSNAAIFHEYIIPNIKHLVEDPEVSVRATYAQCIVQLADTAVRYLEMGQALKAHGSFKLSPESQEYENYEVSYDTRKQDLHNSVQDHLSSLLMDPSSVVKRAVLHDISSLCIFLGRQGTNDVLLSHMITYLNDRDWLLRHAFFESIVDVAACAGGRSLEEYILPLMVQALSDTEESVVARVLAALTSLCELGLFQKMRIWELMSATLGFLYHPNIWIRQGAAAFIASAAKHLPDSDVWCILYPSLRHFLKSDVVEIDEQSLLNAMKTPVSRRIFDAAVQWAMKADKTSWWRGGRKVGGGSGGGGSGGRTESPRESVMSMRKAGTAISRNMSEEDESHYKKLQQIGMTPSEETKLVAMKDYILKLANAIASFSSRSSVETDEKSLKIIGDVELPKLGVVPQTVFLKSSTSEPSFQASRSSRRSLDMLRSPIPGSPRRTFSEAHTPSNVPFEDLRRRLATINGSASSLGVAHTPPRSSALSPIATAPSSTLASAPSGSLSPAVERENRPGSPTESVVSTANSTSFRPLSRMQVGSIDSQKAAPAVGSSKTNALGLLDSHSQLRSDTSPERTGADSPLSQSQTLRPAMRPKLTSLNTISSYDGQEAGINHLLENLYLDNNRELQNDFGPKVHEGPVRRRNPIRHSFVSRDGITRKMDTTLVAHLCSHSDTVTGLAVSPDHMFFVSSSDDKTVKIWDTARLERNVTSKPRHTYGQHHARVKCVCILEGVHCFASAADDGSLHVVRVHVSQTGTLPKYSKLQVIREHRVETIGEYITAMQHYNTGERNGSLYDVFSLNDNIDTSSNLVYTTTHSVITILDLRTMRILQTMENPRQYGPITCLCLDRKRSWILVGTSTGVLTLWDRRFGLLLKSWHVGVSSTGRSVRIHQCVVHPSKGRGKWVIVTVEASKKSTDRSSTIMAEVWDIEKSMLMEAFVVRKGAASEATDEPHELTGVDADSSPAAAIAALVRSRQVGEDSDKRPHQPMGAASVQTLLPPPAADARAIVVGMEFGGHTVIHRSDLIEMGPESTSRNNWRGFMLTGSEDRKIRLWDLGKVERSSVLCGMENEIDKPSYSSLMNRTASRFIESWPEPGSSQNNRPSQRISLIKHNQHNLLKAHQDIITALACIDSPFRGGIVSGDRAGVIKVWRAEAID